METSNLQSLGFLSGPSEILNQAQRASRVLIELLTREILVIRVLQVSTTGLALIAVKDRRSPS
jgi:hypothetical protein